MTDFVGRADPVARLSDWLVEEPRNGQLAIGSISGPGGVGKSYLLSHVRAAVDLAPRKFLTLDLKGADNPRTLADLVTRDLLTSCSDLTAVKPKLFGVTKNARRNLEIMDAKARGELEAAAKADPELAKTVAVLFSQGVGLLELVPLPHAKVAARIGKKIDQKTVAAVVERLQRGAAYQPEKRLFNGALPDWFDRGERNRLRTNLGDALADYLVADLSAILAGWRARDWKRILPDKLPNHDNLLLILDDFESLQEVLNPFLLNHFLPALGRAKFKTLLLVVGRDRVADTHTGWKQHFERELIGEIVLTSFSPDEAREFVRSRGISDQATVERIAAETNGFPFLLASEVEAELNGGRSALGLKLFFDRTTRWMSSEQKTWLRALCFLDHVDRDVIGRVLPDASSSDVLEWFKAEASIRDPRAKRWTVLPIIRSRVCEYVKNDSPVEHDMLVQRAASSSA